MNTNKKSKAGYWLNPIPSWLVLAAALSLAGCRTAGYKKSDAAAWNSQVAARGIETESRQLETVIGALNDLVNQPAADAKPQYLKFNEALNRLETSARRSDKEVNRIKGKRAAYITLWEKEIPTIQDPATRSLSESRKAQVTKQFDAANQRYDEAQNKLQPLVVYLEDIRKALSTDLTHDGLAAMRPSVVTATDRARQVQADLAQSAAEMDALSARTSSYRVLDVQ